MKKIIALILAVMMLGSVSVFATNSLTVGAQPANVPAFKVDTDGKTASQHTDLWLQVEAAGQIDVTVPLLLVFKTNIDGGEATTPDTYIMKNNSTAPLAVTKIVTTTYAENTDTNPMTLVAYTTDAYDEDTYGVQLHFPTSDTLNKDKTVDLHAGTVATVDTTNKTYTQEKTDGTGYFVLPKATASTNTATPYTPSQTNVLVTMETGKLSFVTEHKTDGDNWVLDTAKGVKVLSIAYTVAIESGADTAKGEYMKGSTTGTDYTENKTETYSYDYEP